MKEIFSPSSKQFVDKNSTILSLTPFFDKNNCLCVGGRLKHADIPTNSKNQIILSKDHYLFCLPIKEIHEQNAHAGSKHTLSLLRKHFWIVACRGLIKKVLSNCIYCHRQFVKPDPPCLGNLPKERLYDNAKPFSSTRIDYFGPIKFKVAKYARKNPALNKQYGVIFVCLTMRASHLEVADNLTTESFILALSRFIARRGHVKIVTSDNGSNSIGSEYELRSLVKELDNKRITQHLNSKNIT